MKLIAAKDYADLSRKAANIISAQVIMKPSAVLGLATGSTPLGAYRQLIDWYQKGDVDFSRAVSVNLDEYLGLSGAQEQSYRYFMDQNFFSHINIRRECTFVPDGLAGDPQAECARYNQIIRGLGGIDLQLLGIGGNGHIGFNEPGVHPPEQRPVFPVSGPGPHPRHHHGDPQYHAGKKDPAPGLRGKQGQRSLGLLLRAGDARCSGLYPAITQRLYRDRRRARPFPDPKKYWLGGHGL